MSARAACRLERLGLPEVYDYVGGKMDWLSADLPYEGAATLVSRVLRRDLVVAGPEDRADDLGARMLADPAGFAVVVIDGVVQGVVRSRELDGAAPDATAEQIMRFGITTVRPGQELEPLLDSMEETGTKEVIVTDGDGGLVGAVVSAVAGSPSSGPRP
jgi:CBS domain-containing protein